MIQDINFEPFIDGRIVAKQPSAVGVQVPTVFGSSQYFLALLLDLYLPLTAL